MVTDATGTNPLSDTPSTTGAGATPFFAVSLFKLTVMAVCTLSIYALYWFYCNWKLIKTRESLDISPFWRAFFAFFFCYQCFTRIREYAGTLGLPATLPAGDLAVAWVITTVAWKLPDPYWLITFLAVAFLLPVQAYVNRINNTVMPEHDPNSRFTLWNWVGVLVGGIFVTLGVVNTFLPD
jgi:hypothetical protein